MSVTFVVVSVVLLCFRPIFPFSSFQPFLFIGGFHSSALCRSRRGFPTSIYLQNLASVQPKTSPFKFARSPCTDPHSSGQITTRAEGGSFFLASYLPNLPNILQNHDILIDYSVYTLLLRITDPPGAHLEYDVTVGYFQVTPADGQLSLRS